MISDPTDPVIRATLALDAAQTAYDDAQRAFDAAMCAGVGLTFWDRRKLGARLALAKMQLRSAIYANDDRIDETATLTHMLPALEPVREDEE
jgi:hypothetical protein